MDKGDFFVIYIFFYIYIYINCKSCNMCFTSNDSTNVFKEYYFADC